MELKNYILGNVYNVDGARGTVTGFSKTCSAYILGDRTLKGYCVGCKGHTIFDGRSRICGHRNGKLVFECIGNNYIKNKSNSRW